jgi:hypothetical protein
MLYTVPPSPKYQPPFAAGETKRLEWDARLSMDAIRVHIKAVDVPGVTDEQLQLYRDASIEAAEHYTGMLLACQRTVTEPIQGPAWVKYGQTTYRYVLQYPVADGIVYLYGGPSPADNGAFRVKEGTRTIHVPIRTGQIDMSNCCDPCASPHHLNGGMLAAYRAGFKSVEVVPAGVVLGMLMYIAWAVEHPGDELLTQRNRVETRSGLAGLQGSNNIAMVSGALELWRTFDNEAI